MKYDKYKNSGIDWIGEMPNHWQLLRIKDIGKVVLGKMLNNTAQVGYEYRHYLKSKNINWLNVNIDSVEEMYFSKHEMKQYRIKKNDLLLSEGGEVGKTCIWNDEVNECYIQNSVHKITTFKNKDPRYYLYLSFSLGSSKYYDKIVNQVSIKHLTWEKLIKVIWLVPPIEEQIAIAQYLDTKTQTIDKKINLLTKKADLYKELRKSTINEIVTKGLDATVKLKDSGIDWIGQIPVHWEVKRIKDIFYYLAGGTPSTKEKEYWFGDIPWIPSGKVQNNIVKAEDVDDYISVKALKESSTKMAKSNSILIALTGATCSNIGYLTFDTTINQSIVALLPEQNLNTKYYFNFLIAGSEKIRTYMTGGAQGGINQEDVKFLKVLMPPTKEEQTAIANYLDEKTQKIDAIINHLQLIINHYKELRKTLINDVVTGKIKVINQAR